MRGPTDSFLTGAKLDSRQTCSNLETLVRISMTPIYLMLTTLMCVGAGAPFGEPVCQVAHNCMRIEEGQFEPADPENCKWDLSDLGSEQPE